MVSGEADCDLLAGVFETFNWAGSALRSGILGT